MSETILFAGLREICIAGDLNVWPAVISKPLASAFKHQSSINQRTFRLERRMTVHRHRLGIVIEDRGLVEMLLHQARAPQAKGSMCAWWDRQPVTRRFWGALCHSRRRAAVELVPRYFSQPQHACHRALGSIVTLDHIVVGENPNDWIRYK